LYHVTWQSLIGWKMWKTTNNKICHKMCSQSPFGNTVLHGGWLISVVITNANFLLVTCLVVSISKRLAKKAIQIYWFSYYLK
jgi:hypothetical protein